MIRSRLKPPLPVLMWFGLLGAPFGWALQHVIGISMGFARCGVTLPGGGGPGSGHAPSPAAFDTVTIVATASGVAVALLAGLAAIGAFRATRGAGTDSGPPSGRTHFLATVGLAITPLFLFIILMSGLTATLLPECHQS